MSAGVRGFVAQVACVALAGAALLLPMPAALVERWYAGGLYPVVQRSVTPVANLIPLAVFDLLILLGAVYVLAVVGGGARRAWRARRVAPGAGAVWRVLVAAAAVYLLFLGLWGAQLPARAAGRPARRASGARRRPRRSWTWASRPSRG